MSADTAFITVLRRWHPHSTVQIYDKAADDEATVELPRLNFQPDPPEVCNHLLQDAIM